MSNQIPVDDFERWLTKRLPKMHKNLTGRGPTHTEVRVVGNSIYTLFETELIGSEKMLFEYLDDIRHIHGYHEHLRRVAVPVFDELFSKFYKLLRVSGMEFRIDDHFTYQLIVLNHDLISLLSNGLITSLPLLPEEA